MDRAELAGWLRLQGAEGVGNATARKLLTAFGLPGSIFAQTAHALCEVVSPAQAQALLTPPVDLIAQINTADLWLHAEPTTRRILPLGDPHYPQALLNIEDPPLLLYAMGPASLWEAGGLNADGLQSLAVVGSRNPTPQGSANARQFAVAMAHAGLTVVSGMALGIDAAAHEGALEGAPMDRVATIAIVGTGLDRVYPRQHRVLAHRIAHRGFLLSEYALGTPPLASNFPKRNRIISGLCCGTLVVEAAMQSGSLITARLALEQGKEVFAIPGSIHSTQSRGCHSLIKQGAKLVESAQDILEEIGLDASTGLRPGVAGSVGKSPAARARKAKSRPEAAAEDPVLAALGFDPCGLDALMDRTGMDTASLQARLMALELEGRVARMPGGRFQRIATA